MKIPLLLFCMLLGIGQAWGATETLFSLVLKNSLENKSFEVDETLTLDATYATVSGGTAVMTGKNSAGKLQIKYSEIYFNGSDPYVVVTLSKALAVGDVLTFTSVKGASNQIYLTNVPSKPSSSNIKTTGLSYTVKENDDLDGKSTFYFWRVNSSTYVKSLTITRTTTGGNPVVSNISYENLKGADNSANPDTYTEGTGIESFAGLSDVEGFHFTGWSPSSISTSATGDQTITAQWEEIEPEGLIKLIDNGVLNTTDFRHKVTSLTNENYTVAGKNFVKCFALGANNTTMKAVNAHNKYIAYDSKTDETEVKIYLYNKNSSAKKFTYIVIPEGAETLPTQVQVSIPSKTNDQVLTIAMEGRSSLYCSVESGDIRICQMTVQEKGTSLIDPCTPGYSISMAYPRFALCDNSGKTGSFDGIEMNSNSADRLLDGAYVQLYTSGTNYIKFTLPAPARVKFSATFEDAASAISFNATKAYNADENSFKAEGVVELEAGEWYINPNGKKTDIKKLEFLTPTPKYEVSFETNGGSAVASQSVKEGEKAAKPADPTKTDEDFVNWYEESTFETIFDFENKTITGPTTIYAKFVPHVTSSDATLSSLTVNGENILSGDEVEYTIYVNALPVVEAIKNNAYATVTPTEATALPGTSTYVVEAEDHTLKTYTVNFKSYADACGTLMSAVLTSNTAATVTGIFSGAADLKLSTENKNGGYKLGSNGQYFGLVPTSGSFKKGDVVVIDVTAVSAKLEIFSDKGTTMVASADVVVVGENELVLTADADALYLYRTSSNMNPFVKGISVIRDCKPLILDFVIGDVHATIDHEAETITAELPYGTSLTAITPVVTLGYNVLSCTPEGAQDFSSAVNYVLTGANGTRTYVVTLTVESHDPAMSLSATEGQMAISGKNRMKTIKTTLNAKYMAGTTISAVLPEVEGLSINPTSFVVEGENAEKEFTITYTAANEAAFAALPAVINFRAEGMTDLAYTLSLSAEAWNEIALKSINGDMVFNFVGAVDSEIKGDNDGTYMALVNYPGVKAQANAEYVSVDFNKMPAGHLQGKGLKFHTTVPGFFTIECSNTGSKTYDRELYINGVATGIKSKTTGHVTYTQFAEAGDFVVTVKDEDPQYEWNMFNFYKVTFTAASVVRAGVEAGRMYTYCPLEGVDKDFFSGAEFYVPENFDGSYVNLIKVDELTAGYGYIMVPTASTVYAAFDGVEAENGVAVEASAATHGMQGHLGAQVAIESSHDNVVIVSNHLYYAKNNVIDNGRAYIRLDIVKELEGEPENLAPRRRVGFAANGATDLVEIFETENVQKVLIDGAIYIIREGQMFTVTGQLVK